MTFAERIIADRARRGISRGKYAELCGLTPTKVSNLEHGREPRAEEIAAIEPLLAETEIVEDIVPDEAPPPQHGIEPIAELSVDQEPIATLTAEELEEIELAEDDEPTLFTMEAVGMPEPAPIVDLEPEMAYFDEGLKDMPPVVTDEPPPLPTVGDVLGPALDLKQKVDDIVGAVEHQHIEDTVFNDVEDPAPVVGSGLPNTYEFQHAGYHVSNSELRTFKRCRRKWWFTYYREMRPGEEPRIGPRAVGTRLHLALSSYYSTRREDPMAILEYTINEDMRFFEQNDHAIEDFDRFKSEADLARIMLEGYIDWVKETGADEGIEVIADETIVEAPFMSAEQSGWEPVVLVGKMDLRIRRNIDGARLFLDHKSVGSLTDPLKTLHQDEQMLHYHLLEHLEYLQAGMASEDAVKEHSHGGLYNMLKKVKRTARANPPFFDRVEVRHNIHELRSYYTRVWGEVLAIIDLRKKLDEGQPHQAVAFPNPTKDCSWDCDFHAVCHMFDDGSAAEEMLQAYYVKDDPHGHYRPYGYAPQPASE